ncbi:MAG TPA: hypothetical protein VFM18_17380 [Methanosarcina sp.]|nr:hypothetical protein [Methanosarcina sp.]
MTLFMLWVGLTIGNFLGEYLSATFSKTNTQPKWASVIERSYYQGFALLMAWFIMPR